MKICILLVSFVFLNSTFGQVPDYINEWKNDSLGCHRNDLIDSVDTYLRQTKPSKRWIKKNLGGDYYPKKESMIGQECFIYRINSCSGNITYDPQIFYIQLNKRRFEACLMSIIG